MPDYFFEDCYNTAFGVKHTVFTSSENFRTRRQGISIRPFSHLPIENYEWAKSRIEAMRTTEKSGAEKQFEKQMVHFKWPIENQVYFKIDSHIYFLDYYVPKLNLAIEIDGKVSHNNNLAQNEDYKRDMRFYNIGIRTVRFTAHEVASKDFRLGIFQPRVKACLAQKGYDPFKLYYDIPRCTRFDGKKSVNQVILEGLVKVLEKTPENSQIVIATSHTYLIDIGQRDEIYNPDGAHLDLQERIFALKKSRKVAFLFVGKRMGIEQNRFHRNMVNHWDKVYETLPDKTHVILLEVHNRQPVTKRTTKGKFKY